jgi:amidase
MDDITRLTATELADAIRDRVVSSREAVAAALAKIERFDGHFQAFTAVDASSALAAAEAHDKWTDPAGLGPMHGVPVAVKDVTDVGGFRTTHGSLLMGQQVVETDEVSIARLRAAGAIVVGKTNTPEFGFGAVCTNRFRGPTVNPWDERLTSGGSSGGSAAAVTIGMVALAQGADFGGSVRTPASFCGCVGLRPTPGVIPEPTRPLAWSTLATQGVLARNSDDAELMMRVMSGHHRDDPQSGRRPSTAERTGRPRIAASPTMNDEFAIDPAVRAAFGRAVDTVSDVWGEIDEVAPRATGASAAFKVLRAAESWAKFGKLVETHETDLTESFVWNVRQGRNITAESYLSAEMVRSRTYRAFQRFFEKYDILMLPAASVLPFPNSQGEVTEIDGKPCETIIDYLACTYLVSLVGFPVISLPALWTAHGIPFGVQLVARPDHETTLLHAARALEAGFNFRHRWPTLPGER